MPASSQRVCLGDTGNLQPLRLIDAPDLVCFNGAAWEALVSLWVRPGTCQTVQEGCSDSIGFTAVEILIDRFVEDTLVDCFAFETGVD